MKQLTVSPGYIIGWLPEGTGPEAGTIDSYLTGPGTQGAWKFGNVGSTYVG